MTRIGKPRKRWECGLRENVVEVLGIRARKTKAKNRESWRQRIEEAKAPFGLYTIAAAPAAATAYIF
jgi:hypothetical protein